MYPPGVRRRRLALPIRTGVACGVLSVAAIYTIRAGGTASPAVAGGVGRCAATDTVLACAAGSPCSAAGVPGSSRELARVAVDASSVGAGTVLAGAAAGTSGIGSARRHRSRVTIFARRTHRRVRVPARAARDASIAARRSKSFSTRMATDVSFRAASTWLGTGRAGAEERACIVSVIVRVLESTWWARSAARVACRGSICAELPLVAASPPPALAEQ